jgi:hypothetical protein
LRIGKLDAARRQLQTAIALWFDERDPVAIHTLSVAAYEIVHTISKQRDPHRRDGCGGRGKVVAGSFLM